MTDSGRRIWAIIPMKAPHDSKTRLASVLTRPERSTLAKWMFVRVLTALRKSKQLTGLIAVVCDCETARMATDHGAEVILDERLSGPNDAVEQGCDFEKIKPDDWIMVLPGDIPMVACEDIAALADATRDEECVVICPDRFREGTNALLFPARSKFSSRFGQKSVQAHIREAAAGGLRPEIVVNDNISFDVDTPGDLRALLSLQAPAMPDLRGLETESTP